MRTSPYIGWMEETRTTNTVMVYRFKTFDLVTGEMVAQPIKSTAARIRGIASAEIIEGTGEEVPASAVDADGRCRPQAQSGYTAGRAFFK